MVVAVLISASALGQSIGASLVGVQSTVDNGPGDQTDPHVSGDWVAYSNYQNWMSEIRIFNLATAAQLVIPNSAGYDFLSDVSGSRVVFTRLSSGKSAIHFVDLAAGSAPLELDPMANSKRTNAAIGGNTVAWQDLGFTGGPWQYEVVAFDLGSQVATRLTNDLLLDQAPAVSPQGDVIAWAKCATDLTGCNIWQATRVAGSWVVQQVTSSQEEETAPDTNGDVVVYACGSLSSPTGKDICFKPVSGGAEERLALGGRQDNPTVSKGLVAFEGDDLSGGGTDIFLYELSSGRIFQLTQTPGLNESLNDLFVSTLGLVRVVWQVWEQDFNVYAYSFQLESGGLPPCGSQPTSCDDPGARPLLAAVTVERSTGAPAPVVQFFAASPGDGLLCIANGDPAAREATTSAQVLLNGVQVVGHEELKHAVSSLAKEVELLASNELSAVIMGKPGTQYSVRVFGKDPTCVDDGADGSLETGSGSSTANFRVDPRVSTEPRQAAERESGFFERVPGAREMFDAARLEVTGPAIASGLPDEPALAGADEAHGSWSPGKAGCEATGGATCVLGMLLVLALCFRPRACGAERSRGR